MIGVFVWYSVYSNKEESCCLDVEMYNGLDECDKVVCHEYQYRDINYLSVSVWMDCQNVT